MGLKRYIIGLVVFYLIVGAAVWDMGFIEAPTLYGQLFSFFYIALLWPIVIGAKIIWENYVLSVL